MVGGGYFATDGRAGAPTAPATPGRRRAGRPGGRSAISKSVLFGPEQASLPRPGFEPEVPMFAHEDWTHFRSVETLAQKAGVARAYLRRVVAKELVDNALDVPT